MEPVALRRRAIPPVAPPRVLETQHDFPEPCAQACKINLGLRITGVRPDGMHLIDSLFWPLAEPHDELILTPRTDGRLIVHCDDPSLDSRAEHADPRPRAPCRAGRRRHRGQMSGSSRESPPAAGLGAARPTRQPCCAGSTTGWPGRCPTPQLAACAAAGRGRCALLLNARLPLRVQGIGERITPMPELAPSLSGWSVLLLCPDVHVSTPWAYGAWDRQQAAAPEKPLDKRLLRR